MTKNTHRGSVIVIALWALGIAALITSSIQIFAFRQSLLGIEVHDRIQARWAARAGIETSIAAMSEHTIMPVQQNAFALIEDLEYVSAGKTGTATWDIRHHADGRDWQGPMDEHSKFNLNSENSGLFVQILEDTLAYGVLESIMDWTDEDDEARILGVERDYYLSLDTPYEPRNGPIRSIAEMELIAGIMPDDIRGEDWNLNYRLDSNEDDGGQSLPWDEPNGILEGGWATLFTAISKDGGPTESGEPRINLKNIDLETLQLRLGLEEPQAAALVSYARGEDASLGKLLTTDLSELAQGIENVSGLEDDQLRLIYAETCLFEPHEAPVGRMNINTISPELLYLLFPENTTLVEELLYLRVNNAGGISSPLDYRNIAGISPPTVEYLYDIFDTKSNIFTISSKGIAPASQVEQEIIVVVDRSTLPITILEYREQ
ncbi:MAG: general secretion pathway protein GspK [Planctomycetes bacterium]|nr:general secretion pathway protein GspK [Planctomycetota bacterium]